jgi:phosphatidylglycerophosphatase A
MINVQLDLHLRAAELLTRERQDTGCLTIDSVLGFAAAECFDPRVLLVLLFGFAPFGYPNKISNDDGLLAWACNVAAEAAGLEMTIPVA